MRIVCCVVVIQSAELRALRGPKQFCLQGEIIGSPDIKEPTELSADRESAVCGNSLRKPFVYNKNMILGLNTIGWQEQATHN